MYSGLDIAIIKALNIAFLIAYKREIKKDIWIRPSEIRDIIDRENLFHYRVLNRQQITKLIFKSLNERGISFINGSANIFINDVEKWEKSINHNI